MSYRLSKRSLERLEPLHPSLVRCVHHAITVSQVDFAVFETLRTKETQAEYVRRKVSWTMDSKHLMQADGFAHAVDLVPYIGGKLRWEHEPCKDIADAMKIAAVKYSVPIRWGGAWHVNLTEYAGDAADAQLNYIQTRIHQRRKYTLDGPHFELI